MTATSELTIRVLMHALQCSAPFLSAWRISLLPESVAPQLASAGACLSGVAEMANGWRGLEKRVGSHT